MSIIQIGDIHFPKARTDVIGDLKDHALSGRLQEVVAVNKLRQVFLQLERVRSKLDSCGFLICGDLTTNGNLDEYGKCIDYLTMNMRLDDPRLVSPDHWHVVPGNHDIARKSLQPNESPYPESFRPLEEKWEKHVRANALTVEQFRTSRMVHAECKVDLFSLNSCIGCGEWRRIPEKLRVAAAMQISKMLSEEDASTQFESIAEQLDAPAFHHEHVTAICETIKDLDRKSVAVVLAHHNLLPQATPRLDIYTDLLNSGMLRSRLSSMDRPIVYCHGHIHDDPVEVVINPRRDSGQLVLVSAPEAVDGFNLLNLFFGRNRNPLGLEVIRYRLKNDGDVYSEKPIRISFCDVSGMSAQLDDDVRSVVLASKPASEPLNVVRHRFIEENGREPQYASLRDWLIEAEWHGLVELENRDHNDPKELRVRKAVP